MNHQIMVCPFHSDEDITPQLDAATGVWTCTCPRTTGHRNPGPLTWPMPIEDTDSLGVLADDLNLHIELPAAVASFGPHWVEYGLVEHAYALVNPVDFAYLVDELGHTARGKTRTSVSGYLARTLGRLSEQGQVLYRPGYATGRWSYNSGVSWWTYGPDRPADDDVILWADRSPSMDYVPGNVE